MLKRPKLIAIAAIALGGTLLASPAFAQSESILGGGAANVGVGAGGGGGTGMDPAGGGPGVSGGIRPASAGTSGPVAVTAVPVVSQKPSGQKTKNMK
jgi:hypothetical protein